MNPAGEKSDETLQARMKEAANLKAALDEHAIVAITDPEGRITFVNDKFCALSKYARAQNCWGRITASSIQGLIRRTSFASYGETIAHGKAWHDEIHNRAKDGTFLLGRHDHRAVSRRGRKTTAICGRQRRHYRTEAGGSRTRGTKQRLQGCWPPFQRCLSRCRPRRWIRRSRKPSVSSSKRSAWIAPRSGGARKTPKA